MKLIKGNMMSFEDIKLIIERVFDNNEDVNPSTSGEVREAIDLALNCLDKGELRVAEPTGNSQWKVNQWLKKAVLLYTPQRVAPRRTTGQPASSMRNKRQFLIMINIELEHASFHAATTGTRRFPDDMRWGYTPHFRTACRAAAVIT